MESSNGQDQNNTGTVPVITPPRPRRAPGKWLLVGVLVIAIGVASALIIRNKDQQGVQAEPTTVSVQIGADAFTPQTVKIKKGESVTWVNTDGKPHGVAADPYPSNSELPSLHSDDSLAQNDSYTYTFDQKGTFSYHDPLNPTELKAIVIVE